MPPPECHAGPRASCILGSLKAARSGTLRARQGGEHFETRPELRWAKGGPLVPPPECHADQNASSALKLETPSTRAPHILRIKEVTGPPHIGSDWPDQSLPEAPAPPFPKKRGGGTRGWLEGAPQVRVAGRKTLRQRVCLVGRDSPSENEHFRGEPLQY